MNIAHITIEDACSSLFRSQVVDISKQLIIDNIDLNIDIIVINRPWKILNHINVIKDLNKMIDTDRITIRYFPLLPPLRHSLQSALYSSSVTYYLAIIFFILRVKKYDVIHSRSYWPAMSLLKLGLRKIVFDPRSLWVLENTTSGLLRLDSKSGEYWKKSEKDLINNVDVTTVVSQAMGVYYKSFCNNADIRHVPIGYYSKRFFFDQQARCELRQKYHIMDATVFVYSGSLRDFSATKTYLQMLFSLIWQYQMLSWCS